MSVWLFMIILHTLFAVVCFVAGLAIISPHRAKSHRWLLPTFLISLLGLIVFMIGAMASHWYDISAVQKIVYSALVGLGAYMLYRGLDARKQLHKAKIPEKYIEDIGFTLIALFNGFIIVTLIDLKAPAWLVIAGAVLAVIIGSKSIALAKRRYHHHADAAT